MEDNTPIHTTRTTLQVPPGSVTPLAVANPGTEKVSGSRWLREHSVVFLKLLMCALHCLRCLPRTRTLRPRKHGGSIQLLVQTALS